MSEKVLESLQELLQSIEDNLPRVRERLSKLGYSPDIAIAVSVAKYYDALERLADE